MGGEGNEASMGIILRSVSYPLSWIGSWFKTGLMGYTLLIWQGHVPAGVPARSPPPAREENVNASVNRGP